jgi:predicted dehydrogenase
MKKVNTLLVGAGYHARRIYIPDLSTNELVNFVACLDLKSQEEKIKTFLKEKQINLDCYFTDNYDLTDFLDDKEIEQLDLIIKKYKIEAVVISTEPLAHFKYAKWAIDNDINVLLDKPITTEIDVSVNEDKAIKLYSDFKYLEEKYKEKLETKNLVFMLQAQRRFHEGFVTVKNKIKEMTEMSNCPVTSIVSFHSDGQWRFPKEIIEQDYHPYNQGYGKMSHSGYHSLDIAMWFAESSLVQDKKWDNFQLYTQFIRPYDFMNQLNKDDYLKLFPNMDKNLLNDEIIKNISNVKGELDAFTNISLKKGDAIITNITCNAVHNGFSQRNWIDVTGRDLYKGNGRIRQESYIIEQGPFQSIIINSFQSEEILKGSSHPYEIGGEYHFDIHLFRNNILFPNSKAYEHISIQKIRPISEEKGYSRGHQEEARRNCNTEFFKAIIEGIPVSNQTSNLLTHNITTKILSSIYLSASEQNNGKNGIVKQVI